MRRTRMDPFTELAHRVSKIEQRQDLQDRHLKFICECLLMQAEAEELNRVSRMSEGDLMRWGLEREALRRGVPGSGPDEGYILVRGDASYS